jgi:hypothetical protein
VYGGGTTAPTKVQVVTIDPLKKEYFKLWVTLSYHKYPQVEVSLVVDPKFKDPVIEVDCN